MKIILFPLCVCFLFNVVFNILHRTVATVLIVPFSIDEFRIWKSGFIVTHLENTRKFDHRKDTSTLGSHSGGGKQKATYGLCVISTRLLP